MSTITTTPNSKTPGEASSGLHYSNTTSLYNHIRRQCDKAYYYYIQFILRCYGLPPLTTDMLRDVAKHSTGVRSLHRTLLFRIFMLTPLWLVLWALYVFVFDNDLSDKIMLSIVYVILGVLFTRGYNNRSQEYRYEMPSYEDLQQSLQTHESR